MIFVCFHPQLMLTHKPCSVKFHSLQLLLCSVMMEAGASNQQAIITLWFDHRQNKEIRSRSRLWDTTMKESDCSLSISSGSCLLGNVATWLNSRDIFRSTKQRLSRIANRFHSAIVWSMKWNFRVEEVFFWFITSSALYVLAIHGWLFLLRHLVVHRLGIWLFTGRGVKSTKCVTSS